MRIHIGSTVRTREGDEMGSVERIILNPTTKDVDAVVVHHSAILSRDVVVPMSLVQEATPAELLLRLSRDRLDELPDFVSARYETKPPEDALSYSSYAPGSILFPLVPPYGLPGEPGPYELPVEGEAEAPPPELDIVEGMEVRSLDGIIGTVDEVLTDAISDRTTYIEVKDFKDPNREVVIPIEYVSEILPDHIQVSLTSQQVEELPLLPVTDRYIVDENPKRGKKRK